MRRIQRVALYIGALSLTLSSSCGRIGYERIAAEGNLGGGEGNAQSGAPCSALDKTIAEADDLELHDVALSGDDLGWIWGEGENNFAYIGDPEGNPRLPRQSLTPSNDFGIWQLRFAATRDGFLLTFQNFSFDGWHRVYAQPIRRSEGWYAGNAPWSLATRACDNFNLLAYEHALTPNEVGFAWTCGASVVYASRSLSGGERLPPTCFPARVSNPGMAHVVATPTSYAFMATRGAARELEFFDSVGNQSSGVRLAVEASALRALGEGRRLAFAWSVAGDLRFSRIDEAGLLENPNTSPFAQEGKVIDIALIVEATGFTLLWVREGSNPAGERKLVFARLDAEGVLVERRELSEGNLLEDQARLFVQGGGYLIANRSRSDLARLRLRRICR